ncbi:MAG: NADH-quinone oxidoreductase subunit L, partial [Armatimonadetes bacterium]|nr:NADH-quinone oxidoreductase subunit L [Armatimonadota bacterium]
AFAAALALFFSRAALLAGQPYRDFVLYDWLGSADNLAWAPLHVPLGTRVDALSLVMGLVVTGVGALIHLYSVGYMAEEERYARYFTYLNLFMFAMLLLVLANNYLVMFIGWEGVGLCSYLLIGFWFDRHAPAQAGKKAFLVNRVGDWGFLVGMIALAGAAGTLTFSELFQPETLEKVRHAAPLGIGVITLLLFIGATGKSAQLPLYLWLPDAMEGPTPVSALIHAATMVTAGVYMVARSAPLFDLAPGTQAIIATVGVVTALFAALVAIVQYDIKRILAYSTISQLGFMFIGVGVGAYAAGIAHLVTHAFFKALLFLSAGAVLHALHGELDIRKMGGLSRALPVTAATALIGWLAISGLPGLSGFYSKDQIIEGAFTHGYPGIGWLALFVAAITAFYMTRFFLGVFAGERRVGPHVHIHRETPVMNWPLVALAALSLVGGWLVVGFLPGGGFRLEQFLHPALPALGEAEHEAASATHGPIGPWSMAGLSFIAFLAGGGLGVLGHTAGWYTRGWPEKAGWVRLLENRFYYDWLLHRVFVVGGAAACVAVWHLIDVLVIDGLVNFTGRVVNFFGDAFRWLQTGYVRSYALTVLAGAAFVIGCLLWLIQARPAGAP